jgi:HEAT repeat protein
LVLVAAVAGFLFFGQSRPVEVAKSPAPVPQKQPVSPPAPDPTPKVSVIETPRPVPRPAPKALAPDEDEPVLKAKVLSGEEVYQRLLKSTVFICTGTANSVGCGSGSLIHATRKLVVTNHHVVGNNRTVVVFFPSYTDGEVEPNPRYYLDNVKTLGIRATALLKSEAQDLALLELERVPDGVEGLPLASKPAGAGAKLYSVGASGIELANFTGTLWRLSSGEARARNRHSIRIGGQSFDAMFLENQKPVNQGDSGGPTVNESGGLVAVVSNGENVAAGGRANVYRDVDLTEVQSFLAGYARSANFTWDGPTLASGTLTADAKSLTKLAARLKDPDAAVRLKAVRQILTLGSEAKAIQPDVFARLDDPDEPVRQAAEDALTAIGFNGKAETALIESAMRGTQPNAKRFALGTFARDKGPLLTEPLVPAVVGFLDDPSAAVRTRALTALTRYGPGCKAKALPGATNCLGDEDVTVASAAAKLLELWHPLTNSDIPVLEPGLDHQSPRVRRYAASQLVPLATDTASVVKWFRPLANYGPDTPSAVRGIAGKLKDEDQLVAALAAVALGKLGPDARPAVPELLGALNTPSHPLNAARKKQFALLNQGQGWTPDDTSAALARIGGDELVKYLLPLADFTNIAIQGVKKKRPARAVDLTEQFWAIAMLAALDPATLSADAKKQVGKKLAYLGEYDPDAACRRLANEGAARYQESK